MIRRWFSVCFCLLLALTFELPLLAQENIQQATLPDPWLERAELLTYDLTKDADSLLPSGRALLWANLGEIWWEADTARARQWMQKAVEIVEFHPEQEDAADRNRRLAAARTLLPIIVARDKDLGSRLRALLINDSEQMTERDRNENAKALADAALELLDTEPSRATEFASASFRAGRTYQLTSLLWRLSAHNPKLAEPLFNEALAAARATYDTQLLSALALGAYAGMENPSTRKQVLTDDLCAKLLGVLAEGIMRPSSVPADEVITCRLAPIAAQLIDEFNRLLPQQAVMVRAAITRCHPVLASGYRREVANALRDLPLRNVEDFLRAAEESTDLQTRSIYQMRAAHLAAQQKNFDQAITILDGISIQGREQNLDTWEGLRRDYATEAALEHFKRRDFSSMQQVITATPGNLQAFVYIRLAEKMIDEGYSNAIEFLQEARKTLPKAASPQSLYDYVVLTHHYAKRLPADAPAVFKEAVTAINSAQRLKPEKDRERQDELGWRPIELPISLLEADEMGLRGMLSSIDASVWRIALRCGLLREVLAKQRANKPTKDAATTLREKRNVKQ